MYTKRTISLPSNFKSQSISSFNYTNADIDYMYNYFNCCYADMAYNFIKQSKQGSYTDREKCQQRRKLSYFQTGLQLLSTWYNPQTIVASSTVNNILFNGVLFGSSQTINLYLSSTSSYYTSPVFVSATYSYGQSITVAFTSLISQMAALGHTLTITASGPDWIFSDTTSLVTTFPTYLQIVGIQTGLTNVQYQSAYTIVTPPYTPCVPLTTIQTFVQKMENMCGCFGCKSTASIIKDNNYVSVGQSFVVPPTPVIQPNIYK